MTVHNVVHELLEEEPFSAQRSKPERLDSPATPFVSVFGAREPHLKRSAVVPEPMFSRRRNHGDPLVAQRRVQIKPPNSLKKLLLQKPFLHPYERGVIILHRNHHGGLADDPMPEAFCHSPRPYTHPADDHHQKSAGGELVPDAQPTFEDLK